MTQIPRYLRVFEFTMNLYLVHYPSTNGFSRYTELCLRSSCSLWTALHFRRLQFLQPGLGVSAAISLTCKRSEYSWISHKTRWKFWSVKLELIGIVIALLTSGLLNWAGNCVSSLRGTYNTKKMNNTCSWWLKLMYHIMQSHRCCYAAPLFLNSLIPLVKLAI